MTIPDLPNSQQKSQPNNEDHRIQPVEVFCRVKPLLGERDCETCLTILSQTELQSTSGDGSRSPIHKDMQHSFTRVFHSNTEQSTIFNDVALPLVADVIEGRNALLFAYGVTASGKTYTMQGTKKCPGILPRSLDVVFNTIKDYQTKKYVVKPDSLNWFDVQSEADAMLERQRIEIIARQQAPGSARIDVPPEYEHDHNTTAGQLDKTAAYSVFVSMIEIYNNYVFDLLQDTNDNYPANRTPQTRTLREDACKNIYVSGCTEMEVKSSEEALKIFTAGQRRRRVGMTSLNAESSRSHSVFSIRLVRAPWDCRNDEVIQRCDSYKNKDIDSMIKAAVDKFSLASDSSDVDREQPRKLQTDKRKLLVSQLSLVDLAGAERCARTGNVGDRLKEASNINNSLMGLRKCVEILRANQNSNSNHQLVPYREHKLTHLFKNYFEGDGHVRMLICVSQLAEEYDETINVLKFAETTQEVHTFKTPRPIYTPQKTPRTNRHITTPNTTLTSSAVLQHSARKTPTSVSESAFSQLEDLCKVIQNRDISYASLQHDSLLIDRLKEDLHNATALLQQEVKQREKDQQYFRQKLLSLSDTARLSERETRDLKEDSSSIKTKLSEALEKNRTLERELAEKATQLRQERADKLRQVDYYRNIVNKSTTPRQTPSTQQTKSQTIEAESTDSESTAIRPAPIPKKTTVVSELSRQWEGRFRQNQLAAQRNAPAYRLRSRVPSPPPAPKPPTNNKPAINPRHRRSKSAGQLWLDHQDAHPVPSGTILTPVMKKKLSVTKLEYKDTQKATNYVLTHQQADGNGNLETVLYKGDIIPTCGGGSSVVFSDVECLKQSSPGDRKRPSTNDIHDWDQEIPLDEKEIEERCRIAIVGQPSKKRIKATQL